MMSRLIAKGIIRSYSMRRQGRIAPAVKPNGIVSNCDVCGGLALHAHERCLFCSFTIWFPYEVKKKFDRMLHELQYLDKVHPPHFT